MPAEDMTPDERKVYDFLLKEEKGCSRTKIKYGTFMTFNNIYNALAALQGKGLVELDEKEHVYYPVPQK
jgi:predicted transcriptional regulator